MKFCRPCKALNRQVFDKIRRREFLTAYSILIAIVVRTERRFRRITFVAISARYALKTWCACWDWPDALGVIHTATRDEKNRTESDLLSSAQFYGHSFYTSSANLTAYSILIIPQRSRCVTSRRSCREDWASLSLDHSRRVAFSVRYTLIHDVSCRDWPDALGVIHTATWAEPNITKQNGFGLENKPTFWWSVHTASRTEPNRTEPDRSWSLADVC